MPCLEIGQLTLDKDERAQRDVGPLVQERVEGGAALGIRALGALGEQRTVPVSEEHGVGALCVEPNGRAAAEGSDERFGQTHDDGHALATRLVRKHLEHLHLMRDASALLEDGEQPFVRIARCVLEPKVFGGRDEGLLVGRRRRELQLSMDVLEQHRVVHGQVQRELAAEPARRAILVERLQQARLPLGLFEVAIRGSVLLTPHEGGKGAAPNLGRRSGRQQRA